MRIVGDKKIVKCDICEAPYRNPLTSGWSKTTYRVHTAEYVMVHRPSCPMGMTISEAEAQEVKP